MNKSKVFGWQKRGPTKKTTKTEEELILRAFICTQIYGIFEYSKETTTICKTRRKNNDMGARELGQ